MPVGQWMATADHSTVKAHTGKDGCPERKGRPMCRVGVCMRRQLVQGETERPDITPHVKSRAVVPPLGLVLLCYEPQISRCGE